MADRDVKARAEAYLNTPPDLHPENDACACEGLLREMLAALRACEALLPNAAELNGLRAVHFNDGPYGRAAEAYADRIVEAMRKPGPTPDDEDPRRVYRLTLREENDTLRAEVERLAKERDEAVREADRWRHGVQIEGDYVCPVALERDEYKAAHDVLYQRVQDDIVAHHDNLAALARVTKERDAIERRVAERIAAWLDGPYYRAQWSPGVTTFIRRTAEAIRAGQWRTGGNQ